MATSTTSKDMTLAYAFAVCNQHARAGERPAGRSCDGLLVVDRKGRTGAHDFATLENECLRRSSVRPVPCKARSPFPATSPFRTATPCLPAWPKALRGFSDLL